LLVILLCILYCNSIRLLYIGISSVNITYIIILLQYHCHVLCLNGQHGVHLMLQESDSDTEWCWDQLLMVEKNVKISYNLAKVCIPAFFSFFNTINFDWKERLFLEPYYSSHLPIRPLSPKATILIRSDF
jgi:hypothetical protein